MDGLLLSCEISAIRSLKDGSVSVTLETPELNSSKAGELFSLRKKVAAVYISPKETISQKEIDQVNQIDPEVHGKTQGQRIRNTLYICWQQNPEAHKEFDTYYKSKTEMYIEHLKSKLQ